MQDSDVCDFVLRYGELSDWLWTLAFITEECQGEKILLVVIETLAYARYDLNRFIVCPFRPILSGLQASWRIN